MPYGDLVKMISLPCLGYYLQNQGFTLPGNQGAGLPFLLSEEHNIYNHVMLEITYLFRSQNH